MRILSFFIVLFGIHQAHSQEVSVAQKQTEAVQKFAKKLSILTELTYNTDNKTLGQKDKSSNFDLTLSPSYPLSKLDRLSLVLSANKDLKDERKFTYADSYLGYSRDLYKSADAFLSLNGLSRIYHPTSEESREIKTLRTKLYLAPQASLDFSKRSVVPVTLTYRPYYQQNFHKYKVGYDGKSNTQYSLSQRLIVDVALGELFSISLDNIYGRATTYNGSTSDNFNFDQSIGFSANSSLQFSLGHNNNGNALKSNGKDSNVELFNKNNSTFYLTTSIRI